MFGLLLVLPKLPNYDRWESQQGFFALYGLN